MTVTAKASILKAECIYNPAEVGLVDLVIILVKAYDTVTAIRGAPPLIWPPTRSSTLMACACRPA